MRYSIRINGVVQPDRYPLMQQACNKITPQMIWDNHSVIIYDGEKRGHFTAYHCTLPGNAFSGYTATPITEGEARKIENR